MMMKGTVTHQESFLNRIAENLGRERRKSGVSLPEWKYQPQYQTHADCTEDDLVTMLKDHCVNIHTELIETDAAGLYDALRTQVNRFEGGPVIIPKDSRFETYGLQTLMTEEWPDEGIPVWEWDAVQGAKNIEKAEQANVGITFSEITLAESATVVLYASEHAGRSVSLLPTTYIAIIPKSSIVPRMTQASDILKQQIRDGVTVPSCINYITGPSNSADIEMDLVVGVHGPVKAAYILVNDR